MGTTKMKAIVATGYGSPSVYEYMEVDIPQVGAKDVLVKIKISLVTRADAMMRTGKPRYGRLITGLKKPKYPIPGTAFSGEVVRCGEQVKHFAPGDLVFGESTISFSTNAEYTVVPEDGVILHKPESISHEEAVTLSDGPLTSYNFLKEIAKLQSGQKILINGAAGSLGTAAVQLAKRMGAEVTAVCSSRNTGLVQSLGADFVIDYSQEDFTSAGKTYDVIFDTVGKSSFSKSRRALTEKGNYVSPVLKAGLVLRMLLNPVAGKKRALFAATGLKKDAELKAMLEEVTGIQKDGGLQTIIDRQFPLEKVARAHSYVDQGHKKGNVIIIVQT